MSVMGVAQQGSIPVETTLLGAGFSCEWRICSVQHPWHGLALFFFIILPFRWAKYAWFT